MTEHESTAIRSYAAICGQPAGRWSVVTGPEPGRWYDFFDPDTGRYGQCCLGEDGTWKQDPRGSRPVILEYRGRKVARSARSASGADPVR